MRYTKYDLDEMRRLYIRITDMNNEMKKIKEKKELLFEIFDISKQNFKYITSKYSSCILTEDDLWKRDKEYIKQINEENIVNLHYGLN